VFDVVCTVIVVYTIIVVVVAHAVVVVRVVWTGVGRIVVGEVTRFTNNG
jgi:hypothetical protein